MIRKLNKTCKKINDILGVSVKLPKPAKSTLQAAAVINLAVGTRLAATGIALSSKWCLAAGGPGILSVSYKDVK